MPKTNNLSAKYSSTKFALNPKSKFLFMRFQGLELISFFLEHRSLWPELPEAFTVLAETCLVQETQVRWQGMGRRTDWFALTIWSIKRRVWPKDGNAMARLPMSMYRPRSSSQHLIDKYNKQWSCNPHHNPSYVVLSIMMINNLNSTSDSSSPSWWSEA